MCTRDLNTTKPAMDALSLSRRGKAVAFALEQGARVNVRGVSMCPVLKEGERVGVLPRRCYWPGDIVLFRCSGGLMIHRVLGYLPSLSGLHLLTKGDATGYPDSPVPMAAVLGRVVGLEVPVGARAMAVARFIRILMRPSAWPHLKTKDNQRI